MNLRGTTQWPHKEEAIQTAAKDFRLALDPNVFDSWTFVPIPPSKAKGNPLHDDRLTRMLNAIRPESRLDVRELIEQIESTEAFHEQTSPRPTPEELGKLYRVDESLTNPAPFHIALVDDLFASGTHFQAAKSILSYRFVQADFVGLFLARAVSPP